MSGLFREGWYNYKESIAHRRANRAILAAEGGLLSHKTL
jgi:hypothetical protein